MGKTAIIGLDGVPYGLMEGLSESGVMPYFQSLKKEGVFKPMESTIPEVSSTAWSSIITGKNPGDHGIYGFMELIEGTYTMSFPDFRSLGAPPFWKKDNRKYVIMNVPSTYPAAPLKGFLVSGFISLDLKKATYPPEYSERLKDLDYRVDGDTAKWYKSQDLFVKDLFETLERRIDAYRFLWDEFDWDVFMLVFTGTDRLGHFLWDAVLEPGHRYHERVMEFFTRIDQVIGEIKDKLSSEDSLLMLSDHGFEKVESNVNVNALLREEGFLMLEDSPEVNFTHIKRGTQAFALEPGRVYLNKEGRYPEGSVSKSEEEGLLSELIRLFEGLEKNGRPIFKKIYRKDQIYSGRYMESAPDLLLTGEKGFNLRASLKDEKIFEKDHFTGKHSQDDAFLFLRAEGAEKIVPKAPKVWDVAGIIEKLR